MSSNKFERARILIEEQDLDGWLVFSSQGSDIHSSYLLEIESHSPHFIFIDRNGKHKILAGVMEAPMIKKSVERQGLNIDVVVFTNFIDIAEKLKEIIQNKKIALNYEENLFSSSGPGYANFLRVGEYNAIKKVAPNAEFVSASPIILKLRSILVGDDVKIVKDAVKGTIEILEQVPSWITPDITELELKARIHYEILRLGSPSFDAIVATAANSADPHHNSSSKKIEKGPLMVDMGINIHQIKSDLTWTYWIGGEPPEEFNRAYQALYDSKIAANECMIAGGQIYIPAAKCREVLEKYGYDHKKLFMHSLGHPLSVGSIMRSTSPKELIFEENMAYTNEPGLYWQGKWGIRLEDDLIIKKDKAELLSYVPKDPIVI